MRTETKRPRALLRMCAAFASAVLCAAPAAGQEETPPDPTRLEGAPARIEAQIVDVTQVRSEREVFAATDAPAPERYRLTTPKERPWSFAGARPQQRRVTPSEPPVPPPSARLGVMPALPGSVRYDAFLAKNIQNTRAALLVEGGNQNDEATRGRGAANEVRLRGTLRANAGPDAFHGLVEWRRRASNWQVYDPVSEPDVQRTPKDGAFRRLMGTWDRAPAETAKPRLTWEVDASDYRLEHENPTARADSVGEAAVRGRIAFARELTPRAVDVRLGYERLETPRTRAFSAAALTATFADRYVPFESGVLDYEIGARVYGDSAKGSRAFLPTETGRATRVAVPFRVGFSAVQRPWTWRSTIGFAVTRFSQAEYVERDWVVVNPFLPSARTWSAATSLERSRRQTTYGFEFAYRYARNLPVWVETTDGTRAPSSGPSATAWTPVESLAHLLEGRLYLVSAVSSHGRVTGEVRFEESAGNPNDESRAGSASSGQAAAWRHLPYLPKARASFGYVWSASGWAFDGSVSWVGKRYGDPVSGASLDPYGVLRGTLSRDIAGALTLSATGELAVGERRPFESALSPELYKVSQNAVGVGVRARL